MIIGIIHKGSGLGDQLFSYVATRVRAADLGVDFGFVGKEFFKGASFMNLDWGQETKLWYHTNSQTGQVRPDNLSLPIFEINKPYYDPEFNFIPDGSVIDGYGAQDIRYFEHRLDEVREWLKVEFVEDFNDPCIINFRGGEYASIPELFLPQEYWDKAIETMNKGEKNLVFQVHTDDPETAKKYLKYHSLIGIQNNWIALRYANNAIISNSAFAIIPRLLAHLDNPEAITIAPKFWAGRNVGEWRRPGNYYKKFIYI